MFRKIVSNLPFSPALVGQLGFYAKRLRKEETTRRLGLIFIALALVVQSFAVFQPPKSANASSETNMVSGGICPDKKTIGVNDESCVPNIIGSKTATNTSQGFVDASSVVAHPGDQISYTLTIENTGLSPKMIRFEDHLGDVLEYATLLDSSGTTLNETTKTISWPDVVLNPKDKQTRTFAVRIFNDIPATASGTNNPTSYDCAISNVFGNSSNINIDCPAPKIVEKVASELPKTGPTENIIFTGIILSIATYFYARTRQVKKEVYLIRKDVSTGTI